MANAQGTLAISLNHFKTNLHSNAQKPLHPSVGPILKPWYSRLATRPTRLYRNWPMRAATQGTFAIDLNCFKTNLHSIRPRSHSTLLFITILWCPFPACLVISVVQLGSFSASFLGGLQLPLASPLVYNGLLFWLPLQLHAIWL